MPKKLPIIWATFVKNFVARNFKKSPDLVTLVERERERERERKSINDNQKISRKTNESGLNVIKYNVVLHRYDWYTEITHSDWLKIVM